MNLEEIEHSIEIMSARRQELWAIGDPDREVPGISEEIKALYSLRRSTIARSKHGDPKVIARRARIELELERLSE